MRTYESILMLLLVAGIKYAEADRLAREMVKK